MFRVNTKDALISSIYVVLVYLLLNSSKFAHSVFLLFTLSMWLLARFNPFRANVPNFFDVIWYSVANAVEQIGSFSRNKASQCSIKTRYLRRICDYKYLCHHHCMILKIFSILLIIPIISTIPSLFWINTGDNVFNT